MELILHEWYDKRRKTILSQVMDNRGNIIVGPLTTELCTLEAPLAEVCKANGGRIHKDENSIGRFTYLTGPDTALYKDVLDGLLDQFAVHVVGG